MASKRIFCVPYRWALLFISILTSYLLLGHLCLLAHARYCQNLLSRIWILDKMTIWISNVILYGIFSYPHGNFHLHMCLIGTLVHFWTPFKVLSRKRKVNRIFTSAMGILDPCIVHKFQWWIYPPCTNRKLFGCSILQALGSFLPRVHANVCLLLFPNSFLFV